MCVCVCVCTGAEKMYIIGSYYNQLMLQNPCWGARISSVTEEVFLAFLEREDLLPL
jgi:hypothetical protein